MSLASCIAKSLEAKSGPTLMPEDISALKEIAAANKERGMAPAAAEMSAVNTVLDLAKEAHQALASELTTNGVSIPAKRMPGYEAEKAISTTPAEDTTDVTPETVLQAQQEGQAPLPPGLRPVKNTEAMDILADIENKGTRAKQALIAGATAEAQAEQPRKVVGKDVLVESKKGRKRVARPQPETTAAPTPAKTEAPAGGGKRKITLTKKPAKEPAKNPVEAAKERVKQTQSTIDTKRTAADEMLSDELAPTAADPQEWVQLDALLAKLEQTLHPGDGMRWIVRVLRKLGVGDVVVKATSQEDLQSRIKNARGRYHAVYYQSPSTPGSTRRIVLDQDELYSENVLHAVLHEAIHAVTTPGMLDNSPKAMKVIEDLREHTANYLAAHPNVELEPAMFQGRLYGLTDTYEFLSEALSNTAFQEVLAKVPYKGRRIGERNVLARVFRQIREYFGIKAEHNSVLEQLLRAVPHTLVDEKTAVANIESGGQNAGMGYKSRPVKNIDRFVKQAVELDDYAKTLPTGMALPSNRRSGTRGIGDALSRGISPSVGNTMGRFTDAVFDGTGGAVDLRQGRRHARRMSLGWHTTDQIVRRFKDAFAAASQRAGATKNWLTQYQHVIREKLRIARKYQQQAERINKAWRDFEKNHPHESVALNELIHDSTLADLHPDKAFFDPANEHKWDAANAQTQHADMQRRFDNEIGPGGRALYRRVREFYAEQRNEMRLQSLTHLARVQGGTQVFKKHQYDAIVNAKTPDDVKRLDLSAVADQPEEFRAALKQVVTLTSVPGPYFPLRRFGNVVVESVLPPKRLDKQYKSRKEAWAAARELRKDPTTRIVTRGHRPSGKGKALYWYHEVVDRDVSMFESQTEALRHAEAMAAKGYTGRKTATPVTQLKRDYRFPPGSQAHILMSQAQRKLSKNEKGNAAQKALETAFLELLVENSMEQSKMHRKGISGASRDMRRAFADRAFAGSWALADVETAHDHNKTMHGLDTAAQENQALQEVVAELRLRDEKGLDERKISLVDRVMGKTGFLWHLASPSFTLVNLTQVALVGLPYLQSKYGGKNAVKALEVAYGKFFGTAFAELKSVKFGATGTAENVIEVLRAKMTPDEKTMIDELVKRGIIDATFVQELYEAAKGGSLSKSGAVMNKVMELARTMPQTAEILNRVVMAQTTHSLAVQQGATQEEAIEAASEAVLQTQFDYSDINKPRHFKRFPGARTLMMFKMYAQGMYALILSNSVKGMNLKTTKEAKEARKVVAGLVATHSLAAGALGGIFMEPVRALLYIAEVLFEDEDDPWDLDHAVTEWFYELTGSVVVAEIMARGLPRAFGMDWASRVGLDNLAFMGLEEGRSADDTFWNLIEAAGGPMFAVGHNMFMGADYMSKGEYRRGVEKMTPKLIRDVFKAYGLKADGLVDFNGNVITPGSEFSVADVAMQAAGFTPGRSSRTYEGRRAQTKANMAARDRSKKLKQEWRRTDPQKRSAFYREHIVPFNRANPEYIIKPSALMKSLAEQRRRELRTRAGAYADKYAVRKLGDPYVR